MIASRVYSLSSRPSVLRSVMKLSTPAAATQVKQTTMYPYAKNKVYHDSFNISSTFNQHFDHKVTRHSLTHGPTGSYMPLSDEDINLIPEGLAGEVTSEFELAQDGKKRWMIRDAAKLCCQLVDIYRAEKNGEDLPKVRTSNHSVDFPGLTNCPEWHDSVISVEHYGKELTGKPKISLKASGKMHVDQPKQDPVEMSLKKIKQTGHLVDRILLAGPRGVGKSFALNHTVLHARKSGWLVLFIPNGWAQAQLGSYVQPALLDSQNSNLEYHTAAELKDEEIEDYVQPPLPETNEDTVFDNHEMSAEVLRGFWRAHAAQLREIPIRDLRIMDKYTAYLRDFKTAVERVASVEAQWNTMTFVQLRQLVDGTDSFPELDKLDKDVLADFRYDTFEVKTLEDMLLLGVALRELAGSLFIDLMNELKNLDDPKYPIMIAVDQYNAWEGPSAYSFNNKQIAAKKLCVPYALNFLSARKDDSADWNLKNGVCIAASCLRYAESYKLTYKQNKPSIPLSITVPHYNAVEYLAAASYLMRMEWLAPNLMMHEFLAMRTFTGSNPRLLREQGAGYLLPRMIESNMRTIEEELEKQEQEAERIRKEKQEDFLYEADGVAEDTDEEEDAMVKLGYPEYKIDIDEYDEEYERKPEVKVTKSGKGGKSTKGGKKGGKR